MPTPKPKRKPTPTSRDKAILVRLRPEEHAALFAKADALGLSVNAYVRLRTLHDGPLPKAA